MTTTFHLFPNLPWEIRSRIWELTVEPRTVDVRISYEWTDVSAQIKAKYDDNPRLGLLCLRSSTPVPAPLQACRESRNHLSSFVTKEGRHQFYQKAFSQVPAVRSPWGTAVKCKTPEDRLELGLEAEPRYIWINFEVDMVDTGKIPFDYFEAYHLDIQRWKFARDRFVPTIGMEEYFDDYEAKVVRKVANAKEVHVVCLGDRGVEAWEGAHEECCFACDKDKLWLIDANHGWIMVNAVDNDAMCEEKRIVRDRKNGAFIDPQTMQPFVPYLPPGWFEGRQEWDVFYRWARGYEESYR